MKDELWKNSLELKNPSKTRHNLKNYLGMDYGKISCNQGM